MFNRAVTNLGGSPAASVGRWIALVVLAIASGAQASFSASPAHEEPAASIQPLPGSASADRVSQSIGTEFALAEQNELPDSRFVLHRADREWARPSPQEMLTLPSKPLLAMTEIGLQPRASTRVQPTATPLAVNPLTPIDPQGEGLTMFISGLVLLGLVYRYRYRLVR